MDEQIYTMTSEGAGSSDGSFWDSGFGSSLGAFFGDAMTIGIGALNNAVGGNNGYAYPGLYPYNYGQTGYVPLAQQSQARSGSLGLIIIAVVAYLIFRKR